MRQIYAILATVMLLLLVFLISIDNKNEYDTIDHTVTQNPDHVIMVLPDRVKPWWTEYELDLLAAIIYCEAGSDSCSDRHQQLVGQVVLNRVASDSFPDTIYDVVTQEKPTLQYSTYKVALKIPPDEIPERCYDNALAVLMGEVDCPDNVVFQANFKQGSGIYEEHKTSYSTTYFCYR